MAKKSMSRSVKKRAKPDPRLAGEECVIAPVIPPEEAGKYAVKRDVHAEGDIADYVRSQSPSDDEVRHVELVTTEHVLGRAYEVWDVTTAQDRWWVITNPTNLYSQSTFTSLDYTLSFHVGLMMRVQSRHAGPRGEPDPFDEVMRRHMQASDLLDAAVEAEEFQGVGMALRECLLSLMAAIRRRVELPSGVEAPQAANFKGWSEALLDLLSAGSSNQTIRSYMKHHAKETWELVNWLTHTTSADQTAASIALEACATLIGQFIQLVVRTRTVGIAACPRCSSRDLRTHFDPVIGEDGDYFSSCGQCEWDNHPNGEDHVRRSPRSKPGRRR